MRNAMKVLGWARGFGGEHLWHAIIVNDTGVRRLRCNPKSIVPEVLIPSPIGEDVCINCLDPAGRAKNLRRAYGQNDETVRWSNPPNASYDPVLDAAEHDQDNEEMRRKFEKLIGWK